MKLVILDRDGVINENVAGYVKSPEEWQPIPGSLEAVAKLHQSGWKIFIATNQSAIGRNLIDIETLGLIHQKMNAALGEMGGRIDGVFFCPHAPSSNCRCRKPRPGLLKDISRRLGVDLTGVPFIGDSKKDLDAARAVHAKPMLVLTGNGEKTAAAPDFPKEIPVFRDLQEAARHLLDS